MQRRVPKPGPTQGHRMSRRGLAAAIAAACVASPAAFAQTAQTAQSSSITQVLLYPGGAQVDRSLRVPAGATQARFACLPAALERDALQVQAPTGVNLGELKIERVARDSLPECRQRDPRVREIEQQRAAVEAEIAGVDVSLGYLKGLSDREARPGPALAASLEALRRNAQDLTSRKQVLQERLTDLGHELTAAKAAAPTASTQVSVATLRLSTAQAADIGLSYRLSSAGWQPQYRARLDTATGGLVLERLAQIAQTSGEDWNEVKLKLSTVRPRQAKELAPLQPWTMWLHQPSARSRTFLDDAAPVAAAAPAAPDLSSVQITGSAVGQVRFDPSVFEGEFGTEYDLPQRVTLRANGAMSTVDLGRTAATSRVLVRVQPATDAAAYLLAELPRPQGSWPAGPLQLFRDGALIGEVLLRFGSESTWTVPFGLDERIRVRVEPDKREGADTGFIGARREVVLARQWQVENLRGRPVTLQVLTAAPVPQHEDIRVQAQYAPPVTQADWRDRRGIQMWELPLAPNETQRFQATYRISVPKDAIVTGMP
ncbi:MAG: DUF4139 domain-containing protein [Mitsuaria chitosanitabida]|uniref:DUF4139 domain-containing protein n=1 Tax=Roseateles chitosanitabidus TaxID=65048 RepID=UPI001B21314C|nr:DUF4139 domain-containing protein [Roseateles chitosanitabidus]MBO9686722.1 DUF4139 domain-containing protein [Roseateles chitosanitabidus]